MRIQPGLAIVLASILYGSLFAQGQKPFLSNLAATRDSPIYTTYAAPMAGSEFTLDKGYHFVFYDSSRGADFTNEKGGDLCLAFVKDGKYVYAISEMYRQPVITASYADMVLYTFQPFKNISVNVTFCVCNSHHAVQVIDIKNTDSTTATIQVLPFLRNTYRTFDSLAFRKEAGAITCTHEEFPDDWVIEHKIPYVAKVADVYLLSDPPDRMTSFRSYQPGPVVIPSAIDLQHAPVYLVWGRMSEKGGGRCSAPSGTSRLMAMLNNDRRKIVTETAPRRGSPEENLTSYGYYGIELGNFTGIREGDQFTIYGTCGDSGGTAVVQGVIRKSYDSDSARLDMHLGGYGGPKPPVDVTLNVRENGKEVDLSWKKSREATAYNVYRRDYHAAGSYDLIAENLPTTSYADRGISPDRVYGYVVVALSGDSAMSMHSREVNTLPGTNFLTSLEHPELLSSPVRDLARVIAFSRRYELRPGYTHRVVAVRSVGRPGDDLNRLIDTARALTTVDTRRRLEANEALYHAIPAPHLPDPNQEMLYWSAFSLMRQVMLPPEGKCHYNYYVFSREPQWGWGHGGQVFHESLSMLAYALMDPASAMNSQRVYMERQKPDGYINYRTGPYLDEEIPTNDQLTTSAPWYAWQNWEIYKISHDKAFLEEAYRSSASFYTYYVKNRDRDHDGLCEWGGHAVLESVRDANVAVWDQVGWPSNFEAVDLNSMLVSEAKALGAMARELGRVADAKHWDADATARAAKINATMWDDATGFYYNVEKSTHSFSFKGPNDLKRQEIIGFLPLWAGVASREQAKRLVDKLTDPGKFWRTFGVPSLSADDRYYNPKGYWNGPVWVEWNYLIERGLLQYGYVAQARELVSRVAAAMVAQLRKDHNFWEFYSPDDAWAGYHKTYIWAGMISRMLMDVQYGSSQR